MKIPTVTAILKASRQVLSGEGVVELETTLRSTKQWTRNGYTENMNWWNWEDDDIDHESLSATLKRWRKDPPVEDVIVFLCAFGRHEKITELELTYNGDTWHVAEIGLGAYAEEVVL